MKAKYKSEFELINNSLWLLLKPYVEDDKLYKKIMSEVFNIYIEKDQDKNKFSDEWFDSLRDLYNVPEKYKTNQGICGFGADLADDFYDWLKWQYKSDGNIKDFYRIISNSFLNEWERLRNGQGTGNGTKES